MSEDVPITFSVGLAVVALGLAALHTVVFVGNCLTGGESA